MAIVLIDGREVELDDQQRLNGIQAAELAGIEIPHYCWHPGLSVVASCRMCLVETGRRDPESGEISMVPKLVPACQTPAADNTVFVTNSPAVENARAMVEEDLLLRHPVDCSICDKAGECLLQDYHFKYGRDRRRADIKPFNSRRRSLGDTVTLFVDRCVMCSRCVRFCREVSGTSELMVVDRGAREEIDVFPGFPLDNKMSGNVVDLCPVGALGDQDFLYQQRVWFMKRHAGVCANCSTGCSIYVEENQDQVYRLKPRANPHVNQWWICDEGRYGWKHLHDPRRLLGPRRLADAEPPAAATAGGPAAHDGAAHDGAAGEGRYVNVQWSDLPQRLDDELRAAGRLAAVLSPLLTVEEAFLLGQYLRRLDPHALLALGPVPRVGEDERFASGFTIRAEKCPNRRGVEQVIAGLTGELITWQELLDGRLAADEIQGLWIAAGYPQPWHDASAAEALAVVPLVIVQDLFPSPLSERATWQLPDAAFAEREGSYVNHADRLQSFSWAVRPPAGVMPLGRLAWRLLERPGVYQARPVLDELARSILYFSAATGPIGETGLDLKVNQLV